MKYFKEKEFMMGDVCVYEYMNTDFLNKLDTLRDLLEHFIVINSSYRSEDYNKSIGGSKNSMHLLGRAVDVDITRYDGATRRKLVSVALGLGLTVGVSKTFIHIDDRENSTLFGY